MVSPFCFVNKNVNLQKMFAANLNSMQSAAIQICQKQSTKSKGVTRAAAKSLAAHGHNKYYPRMPSDSVQVTNFFEEPSRSQIVLVTVFEADLSRGNRRQICHKKSGTTLALELRVLSPKASGTTGAKQVCNTNRQ